MRSVFNLYVNYFIYQIRLQIRILTIFVNKIIMKVERERNPYLKRILSQQPHKYSYDIQSGKYFLMDHQGKNINVNMNGTLRPKFKTNFSGFVNHKNRYKQAQLDPSVLHFAPSQELKSKYICPRTQKFAGYAQFPYKLNKEFPKFLSNPKQHHQFPKKKALSFTMTNQHKKQQTSKILQYSTQRLLQGRQQAGLFNSAWNAMAQTKPLPKFMKKTCYNYKCKFMKQFVFDEKEKIQASRLSKKKISETFSKSFHETALERQMQESKLISTMAMSGILAQ